MTTDYEKYIELLNLFEVPYVEEITTGSPAAILVYVTEDFNSVFPRESLIIHNKHSLYKTEDLLSDNAKVRSYRGFYYYFSFDKESGKFDRIGIYE